MSESIQDVTAKSPLSDVHHGSTVLLDLHWTPYLMFIMAPPCCSISTGLLIWCSSWLHRVARSPLDSLSDVHHGSTVLLDLHWTPYLMFIMAPPCCYISTGLLIVLLWVFFSEGSKQWLHSASRILWGTSNCVVRFAMREATHMFFLRKFHALLCFSEIPHCTCDANTRVLDRVHFLWVLRAMLGFVFGSERFNTYFGTGLDSRSNLTIDR